MWYNSGMQNFVLTVVFGVAVSMACADDKPVKITATMEVPRCQAVLDDGSQCKHQVEAGKRFCWRHSGAVKTLNQTWKDAGKGANNAWRSTKEWSTNTWEATKSGAQKAWEATKERAEEARTGFAGLFEKSDAKRENGK